MSDETRTNMHECRIWLCDLCLDGAGGECHTPTCAMYLNRAPDLPLRKSAFVEVDIGTNVCSADMAVVPASACDCGGAGDACAASMHEAYGVLEEERDELFDAVKLRQSDPTRAEKIRKEAIDVAAVALRIAKQASKVTR